MLRDWTQSERIDELTAEAERFFTRLIMKVDDYGCFYADPRLLKANLFPLKLDKIREADIPRWMAECQKAGLIALYEYESKKYLQINNFGQRKRQMTPKFPLPVNCQSTDGQLSVNCPPEDEVEKEREVEVGREIEINNKFYEFFRRAAGSHFTEAELRGEVGKFRNKYPNIHVNQSGALINAWISNIGKAKPEKKGMVL